ncbi:EAL domain-containing protein [Klebsiella pneumoniae subsp. pneumoniae]|nr:EAL domain-containing protein [Klebsiella pneumoniae subsp. pneumoniae]
MLIFLLSLFGIITGCWMVSLIDSVLEAKNSLEKRFIRAVKKKDFYIEYQPIVQASDRVVVAYEALVRWQDRYFGRVSPELFIGLASRLKTVPETIRICDGNRSG